MIRHTNIPSGRSILLTHDLIMFAQDTLLSRTEIIKVYSERFVGQILPFTKCIGRSVRLELGRRLHGADVVAYISRYCSFLWQNSRRMFPSLPSN